MDEAPYDSSTQFSDTEETALEKGGFVLEKIFHETNTGNARDCE